MDEEMSSIILQALCDHEDLRNQGEDYPDEDCFIADRLTEAGYRKDPYPTGKTKDQLIEIIEGLKSTNAQLTIKIAELETALKGVKP